MALTQLTDYPWQGQVTLTIDQLKARKNTTFAIALRQPAWASSAVVTVNGQQVEAQPEHGYLVIERAWKNGDVISYDMPMQATILEANPLVEESRGQMAVMRGPILYCLESSELGPTDIDHVVLPADARFQPVEVTIGGSRMMALQTEAFVRSQASWAGQLYRPASAPMMKKTVRLVPYYAWGNRGKSEMTVWMPVAY